MIEFVKISRPFSWIQTESDVDTFGISLKYPVQKETKVYPHECQNKSKIKEDREKCKKKGKLQRSYMHNNINTHQKLICKTHSASKNSKIYDTKELHATERLSHQFQNRARLRGDIMRFNLSP